MREWDMRESICQVIASAWSLRVSACNGTLYLGVIVLLLSLWCGCAISNVPSRDYVGVTLVDQSGAMTPHRSAQTLDKLAADAEGEPEDVMDLVANISSLSDVPIYKDNAVHLLIDGPATYDSMFEAIESARHYILLETYIFADDEAGQQFADLLSAKSSQEIVVKVIYDSLGSADSDETFFSSMAAGGVQLIEYNNFDLTEGGNPLRINNRDHRKLLIVDGEVAFTGGINLSSTYSSSSGGKPTRDVMREGWRDTHIAVRGPAVQGFQEVFLGHWQALGGSTADVDTVRPVNDSGREIVAILTAKGGDGESSAIFSAYLDAVQVAAERIWITQAYFAPDEAFLAMLENAAGRGVDVRLLVPGVSDSAFVLSASRSRYGRLLESGIRIFENRNALLHAKTAVIDGIWSTVGSSNLDYRSFLHNDEINAIILGSEFAAEMESQFEKDTSDAEEILLSEWKNRSLRHKIGEALSWAIEYWL
jgi:cardiolipin synthase